MQKYKYQLGEVSSTVEIFQQHASNLKQGNLNLQEKTRKDRQDLEKYCEENELHGRCLCMRTKNIKKQKNKSSDKVLEANKCLFIEADNVLAEMMAQ